MSKHIDANKPEMDFAANWTPMSERLPDEGGTYLVCWDGKTVDTGFFINGHFRLYGEIKDHLITAWMPMPDPWSPRNQTEEANR